MITLDVMMPGQDGWAVLSELKADPELADIPVVMLTIVDDKNLGYALGASDYLTKPIQPETQGIPIIALTAHAMAGDREKCLDYDSGLINRLPELRIGGWLGCYPNSIPGI